MQLIPALFAGLLLVADTPGTIDPFAVGQQATSVVTTTTLDLEVSGSGCERERAIQAVATRDLVIAQCHSAAMVEDPELSGELAMRWTAPSTGSRGSCELINGPEAGSPQAEAAACVSRWCTQSLNRRAADVKGCELRWRSSFGPGPGAYGAAIAAAKNKAAEWTRRAEKLEAHKELRERLDARVAEAKAAALYSSEARASGRRLDVVIGRRGIRVGKRAVVVPLRCTVGGQTCQTGDQGRSSAYFSVPATHKSDGDPRSFLLPALQEAATRAVDTTPRSSAGKPMIVGRIEVDPGMPQRLVLEVVHSLGMAGVALLEFVVPGSRIAYAYGPSFEMYCPTRRMFGSTPAVHPTGHRPGLNLNVVKRDNELLIAHSCGDKKTLALPAPLIGTETLARLSGEVRSLRREAPHAFQLTVGVSSSTRWSETSLILQRVLTPWTKTGRTPPTASELMTEFMFSVID